MLIRRCRSLWFPNGGRNFSNKIEKGSTTHSQGERESGLDKGSKGKEGEGKRDSNRLATTQNSRDTSFRLHMTPPARTITASHSDITTETFLGNPRIVDSPRDSRNDIEVGSNRAGFSKVCRKCRNRVQVALCGRREKECVSRRKGERREKIGKCKGSESDGAKGGDGSRRELNRDGRGRFKRTSWPWRQRPDAKREEASDFVSAAAVKEMIRAERRRLTWTKRLRCFLRSMTLKRSKSVRFLLCSVALRF